MILFEESGLSPEIVRAVKEMGFEKLTPIQEKSIPHILNYNQDIIASAQTGTGKTAAFGLPIIDKIDANLSHTQVLILAPTRELAIQIADELTQYSKYHKKLNVVAVYGGANIVPQIAKLNSNPHIVIGTPGRTLDLINRRKLSLANLDYVVLDEADEMLSMGFSEDLDEILSHAPEEKQTLLFSATLPPQIKSLAKKYMHDPLNIFSGELNKSSENVKHVFFKVQNSDKYEVLRRFIDLDRNFFGIIFCRTRRETGEIAALLMKDGFRADAIHGELSQAQRDTVMDKFRKKIVTILVATDVAARGIDVDDLTHVVHYQLPDDLEVFIHRSGRTGRAGKTGVSVALVNKKEIARIKMLEKKLKQSFEQLEIPKPQDVFASKLERLGNRILEAKPNKEAIDLFFESFNEKFASVSKEALLKNILSIELSELTNSSLNDHLGKNAKNDVDESFSRRGKERFGHTENSDFSRLFVNLGKKHNINPGALMQLFNSIADGVDFPVGKIEIENGFSFIEVPHDIAEKSLELLKDSKYKGFRLNIEKANKNSGKNSSFGSGSGGSRDFKRSRSSDSKKDKRSKNSSFSTPRSTSDSDTPSKGRRKRSYN